MMLAAKTFLFLLCLSGMIFISGCGAVSSSVEELSKGLPGFSDSYLRLKISSPTSTNTSRCIPLVLNATNSFGQTVIPNKDLSIELRGVTSAEIFTDSSCATSIPAMATPTVTWPAKEPSYSFFFKAQEARIYNVQVSESGASLTEGEVSNYIGSTQIIDADVSTNLQGYKLALSGPSSLISGECKTYVVSMTDSSGTLRTQDAAITIQLSGPGAGTFHEGTSCAGAAVTSLNLPANTSLKSFSYKNSTAETLVLTADAIVASGKPAVSSIFMTVSVLSGAQYAPNQLALSGPSSGTAGSCTGPLLVKSLDSFGNSSLATTNITFSLIGSLGFQAYADAACLTPLLAPQIASGSSAMNFYFTTSSAGNLALNVDDSGPLLDAALTVAMAGSVGGTASKIAITGPTSLPVNTCSSAFLVRTQDGSSIDYPVSSAVTVTLTGKGAGDFYADSSCTAIISSVSFASGDSIKSFYYKSPTMGSVVFNADDAGPLIPGSHSVNNIPGAATKLAISGPTSLNIGDCRAYTVSSQDASSFASVLSSASAINLSGPGFFYTDSSCSIATSTVVINAGSANSIFYYKSMTSGAATLLADNSGALTSGSLNITVAALPAVKVAFNRPVMNAGICTPVTVTLKDSLNGSVLASSSTTVNLTGTGAAAFYSAADCNGGSVITSVSVPSGQSSAALYVKDVVAEAITLTAASSGLASDNWSVTVGAGAPAALALAGSASLSAGACVPYTITLKDAQNNTTAGSSPVSVVLAGVGSGKFSAVADCTSTIASVTFASGVSQALVYYVNNSSQNVTLTADSAGLIQGALPVTVNSSGAVKTKWTVSSSSLPAGTCVTATLQIQDALNNPVIQGSAATINISGQSLAQLYSSLDCTTGSGIASVTVPAGSSQIQFSFKDNVAEVLNLSATSAGLSAGTQTVTFVPGAPAKLSLQGPAASLAGECTAYDLRVEDSLGNLSALTGGMTVTFGGLSAAKFYADASCSSQISSVSLTTGSNLRTVYLKDTVAESLTVTGSGGSLTSASKAVVFSALPTAKLTWSGATSASVQACTLLTVTSRDSLNNAVIQGSPLSVDLLGAGNGAYFSDAACTVGITNTTIAAASSSQNIYFKSSAPENLNLLAQSAGLVDGSKSFVVNPLAASKLVLTGLASFAAQSCTGFTVSSQDSLGNLSATGTNKILTFSGVGTGSFYGDSSCTSAISSANLSSSQTSVNVYYKATAAQSVTLSVDDSGLPDLTAGTLAVTVNSAGGGAVLALKFNGSSTLSTNTCSPYALTSVDAGGASINTTANLAISLAGAGTGDFFTDSACTTSASGTVTMDIGTSLKYVYFKAATAQNLVFSASASGYSTGTFPISVTPASGAGGASKLTWSGSSAINTNDCIPYVVTLADNNGNSVNASTTTAVTLQGAGAGDFYTDNVCAVSAAGAASIANGQSFTTVYFKNPTAQNLILIAQSAGLSNGTHPLTVSVAGGGTTSGPAVKLSFLGQPSSVGTVNVALANQPVVAIVDSNNNVVSAASNAITLQAYSDASCNSLAGGSLTATTNPVTASGGVANFAGVRQSNAQTMYLKATAAGLVSACSTAVQVNPSVPVKLAFQIQPSATVTAGASLSTQPTVAILNHSDQVMTGANNPVQLDVYSDSGCSVAATGTGFSVTTNPAVPTSGISLFAGTSFTKAGTVYLKATSAGLTSACSTGITVGPAAANKLTFFTQPPSSVVAGIDFAAQVRVLDAYNNLIPSSDTIVLSAHPNSDCTGVATGTFSNNSVAASLGTASYTTISYTKSGALYIKATDSTTGGVAAVCSSTVIVQNSETLGALSFTTQPATSTGDTSSAFTTQPVVAVNDVYGNLMSNSTVGVSLAAFSDASCMTPATGTLSAYGGLSKNSISGLAVFSGVGYNALGTIYLKATASGATPTCSSAVTLVGGKSILAVGPSHSCAVASGNVYCWGNNAYGQLGNGTTMNKYTPTAVLGVGGVGYLSNIRMVTVGDYHSCAVDNSGSMYCWGYNAYGQIGDNTSTGRYSPVQVKDSAGTGFLANIVSVTAGYYSTCAVINSGSLYCWGYNGYGQLGDGTTTGRLLPNQVRGVGGVGFLSNIKEVASGFFSACAASTTGAAFCWGTGSSGLLGNNSGTDSYNPVQVSGVGGTGVLSNVREVSVSSSHACAGLSDGTMVCWGNNGSYQLGDNTVTQRNSPVFVKDAAGTGTLSNVKAIYTGGAHSCALNNSGNIYCWGGNGSGQIGDNTTTQRTLPVLVKNLDASGNLADQTFLGKSYNANLTCSVSNFGEVHCWGSNGSGQLGIGNTTNSNRPVRALGVGQLPSFSSLAVSGYTSCGVLGGAVYCWGYNNAGQLGDGTTVDKIAFTQVKSPSGLGFLNGISQVVGGSSNGNSSFCAVSYAGNVYCWGLNSSGQVGDATTTNRSLPVLVKDASANPITLSSLFGSSNGGYYCGVTQQSQVSCWGATPIGPMATPSLIVDVGGTGVLSDVVSIAPSNNHTCALKNSGSLFCWGTNSSSQFGNGNTTPSTSASPIAAASGMKFSRISASNGATCGLRQSDSVVHCWGPSSYEVGTPGVAQTSPTSLGSGVVASKLSSEASSTCAVTPNGGVYCWGTDTYGEIGRGSNGGSFGPGWVYSSQGSGDSGVLFNNVVDIVSSDYHRCALTSDGQMYCWGYGAYGQLGFGDNSNVYYPRLSRSPDASPSNLFIRVSAGANHTCGIGNGQSYCWGSGASGKLGTNSTSSASTPQKSLNNLLNGLSNLSAVSVGQSHSCVLSSGQVSCWGDGLYGKLGNGGTASSPTAVDVAGEGGIGRLSAISSLAAGYNHTCASGASGQVYCWGRNNDGQLGTNSNISMATPVKTLGVGGSGNLTGATQVASGFGHSCALVTGKVYCWGRNDYGQLGNGSYSGSRTPVQVVSVSGSGELVGVTAITAGAYHTCALAGTQVLCWGRNESGQLGDNSYVSSNFPVGTLNSGEVSLTGIVEISAGAEHTCARTLTGNVMCWGAGANGQLGLGYAASSPVALTVVNVGGSGALSNISSLAVATTGYHSCAVGNGGANVYCWGANNDGQLGNGTTTSSLSPVNATLPSSTQSYFIAR